MYLIDQKLVKFLAVGVVNTIIGAGIMFLLYNILDVSYWISSACNYLVDGALAIEYDRKKLIDIIIISFTTYYLAVRFNIYIVSYTLGFGNLWGMAFCSLLGLFFAYLIFEFITIIDFKKLIQQYSLGV